VWWQEQWGREAVLVAKRKKDTLRTFIGEDSKSLFGTVGKDTVNLVLFDGYDSSTQLYLGSQELAALIKALQKLQEMMK
jgi:hypothetical protein